MKELQHETLYGGIDFNVEHEAAILSLFHNGALYVFKEYHNLLDTPEMIDSIRADFPDNKIVMHPDATGIKRGSVDAGVSDIALLRKARFTIRARSKNPFIKDRVASVNNALNNGKLFIDTDLCPELTEAMEQQIWKPNGLPDKESGLDHIVDALGYMVAYMMPVRQMKPSQLTVVS